MRALLQDHMDPRSIREPRRIEVIGSDQVARRRIEPGHKRLLATVFGPVTVTRTAYRALGAGNLHPLDAGLNLAENTQTVISAVFDQAERRDPDHQRTWIVLVDGARPQIEQILTEAAVRGVEVQLVCDFIHVLEYLWKAAWCFHGNGDPAAERFVARHATTLLTHGPSTAAPRRRCPIPSAIGRGSGNAPATAIRCWS
jgi:hypothetical protein